MLVLLLPKVASAVLQHPKHTMGVLVEDLGAAHGGLAEAEVLCLSRKELVAGKIHDQRLQSVEKERKKANKIIFRENFV